MEKSRPSVAPWSFALTGQGASGGRLDVHRATRLDAVREAVAMVGALPEATAMLLSLSGADVSWPVYGHGLRLDRIPELIANTVELILVQLRAKAGAET